MIELASKMFDAVKPKQATEIFRVLTPILLLMLLNGQGKIENNLENLNKKVDLKLEENAKERFRLVEANEKDKLDIRNLLAQTRFQCCSEVKYR